MVVTFIINAKSAAVNNQNVNISQAVPTFLSKLTIAFFISCAILIRTGIDEKSSFVKAYREGGRVLKVAQGEAK